MPRSKKLSVRQVAMQNGWRSGLEEKVAEQLVRANIPFQYEELVIAYHKPITAHRYTPDFVLDNGIIVETKGRFLVADRKKHLLVKEQHPQLDIRFVFSNSKAKISASSKTSYADWCDKNGFKYADKLIPTAWLKE